MIRLDLARDLRTRIEREARGALPRECCGLIEGVREGELVRATRVHATRNIAADNDRFEIDPAEHFVLLRAARASGRTIVGCYHSHPDGNAELSLRDRNGAGENGFIWLVVALHRHGTTSLIAYLDNGQDFVPIELVELDRSRPPTL